MADFMIFTTPIWVGVVVGVLVGWAWKPQWANNLIISDSAKSKLAPGKGMFSILSYLFNLNPLKMQLPSWISDYGVEGDLTETSLDLSSNLMTSSLELQGEKSFLVTADDLVYLNQLVEESDGGPAWIQMMDRSTSTMSYQAWRRDAEGEDWLCMRATEIDTNEGGIIVKVEG